jgi:hypothetical protein
MAEMRCSRSGAVCMIDVRGLDGLRVRVVG